MLARSGEKDKNGVEIKIHESRKTWGEKIGPEGGSERSGAKEDSSGNGLIAIVALQILDSDREGANDGMGTSTRGSWGRSVRGRDQGNARVAGSDGEGNGRIPFGTVDVLASTRHYQSAVLMCDLKQG